MKKLEVVSFLRGYAIFTIILMHLVHPATKGFLNTAASFGGGGVHVFILVSGFGLYLSHLRKPATYPEFMQKRFSRVYLPYLLVLPLFVIFYYLQYGAFDLTTLLSHVFLFKMFDHTLDTSYAYSLWFISTIIQFYLCWPVIIRLFKGKWGLPLALVISLAWATLVGVLGKENDRAWNSCFLQYLWEFVAGMKLAELYHRSPERVRVPGWGILLVGAVVGMALTGVTGKVGGIFKLYNDIPSLLGYLSLALIIYKLSIPFVNHFFLFTDKIGYEWYLVHGLAFLALRHPFYDIMPIPLALLACWAVSYMVAMLFSRVLTVLGIKKRAVAGINEKTNHP